MESQFATLQAELAEYDRLKSTDISVINIDSLRPRRRTDSGTDR